MDILNKSTPTIISELVGSTLTVKEMEYLPFSKVILKGLKSGKWGLNHMTDHFY